MSLYMFANLVLKNESFKGDLKICKENTKRFLKLNENKTS